MDVISPSQGGRVRIEITKNGKVSAEKSEKMGKSLDKKEAYSRTADFFFKNSTGLDRGAHELSIAALF